MRSALWGVSLHFPIEVHSSRSNPHIHYCWGRPQLFTQLLKIRTYMYVFAEIRAHAERELFLAHWCRNRSISDAQIIWPKK